LLERTFLAIVHAGAIHDRAVFRDLRSRLTKVPTFVSEFFASRTAIAVRFGVKGEIGGGEPPGLPADVIPYRDVRQDCFLFRQPAEEVR